MKFRSYKSLTHNPYTVKVNVNEIYSDGEKDLFHLLGIKTASFNPNPFGFTNGDDCTVRAICALLYQGITPITKERYMAVYAKLAEVGANQGRIINHLWVLAEFLKPYDYVAAEPRDNVSVATFLCSHRTGRYIVSFATHVYAYIDGTIYDLITMFEQDEAFLGYSVDMIYCHKDELSVLLS